MVCLKVLQISLHPLVLLPGLLGPPKCQWGTRARSVRFQADGLEEKKKQTGLEFCEFVGSHVSLDVGIRRETYPS